MKPWSSAKGWTPRRIDLAVWRFVLIPAITAAILLTAAFLATFAKADEYEFCPDDGPVCFDKDYMFPAIVIPAKNKENGETGWIVVNCAARIAAGNSPWQFIEAGTPTDKLCDTIGSEE